MTQPIRVPSQRGSYGYYVYETDDQTSWRFWAEVHRRTEGRLEMLAEHMATVVLYMPKRPSAAERNTLRELALDVRWTMVERDLAWQVYMGYSKRCEGR